MMHIRPVQDLRNNFTEIDSVVKAPELTSKATGSMNRKEGMLK